MEIGSLKLATKRLKLSCKLICDKPIETQGFTTQLNSTISPHTHNAILSNSETMQIYKAH